MLITQGQAIAFLTTIYASLPDEMDCDGCFELIAEFADSERCGEPLTQSLVQVRTHLNQCPCCAYEYDAMLEAIKESES